MKKLIIAVILVAAASMVYGQGLGGGIGGGIGTGAGGSNKAMDKANDAMDKMNGNIPMRFFNALNREPIPGAVVEISNVGDFTTDNQGKIAFPKVPDGNYSLIFSKDNFITTPIDFRVQLGTVVQNWYSISPGIAGKDYRIILEWGEKPADLDIHFEKKGGSGKDYHIAYSNMKSTEDGNAVLDRDDKAGYGPETITIEKIETNATYTCYVFDYTNRNAASSTQIAQSGAVLRVYSQNKLMYTINIPTDGKGPMWNAFKIERGALRMVNTVSAK